MRIEIFIIKIKQMNQMFVRRALLMIIISVLVFFAMIPLAETGVNKKQGSDTISDVFFTSDVSADGVMKVFEKIRKGVKGNVGIKVHFGEEGNKNFLPPSLVEKLTRELNATWVETNVLYVSPRRYTDSHIALARKHGFTFAPIDILDSEGEIELPAKGLKHFKSVRTGSRIDEYSTYVIFSHFKGHGSAGFGGAIKNVSMGMASIGGKMAMHASSVPLTDASKCTNCGICPRECPADAISLNPVRIDPEKCIGCGLCIGICPDRVFTVPWRSTEQSVFLERLAEYAYGIAQNRNMLYINVLANISKACDCSRFAPKPFMDDIGILASTDIVAIEQASHDLIDQAHNCDDTFLKVNKVSGKQQIEYAHKLGMGNIHYQLIKLD
jgi:uncharacterized protein